MMNNEIKNIEEIKFEELSELEEVVFAGNDGGGKASCNC